MNENVLEESSFHSKATCGPQWQWRIGITKKVAIDALVDAASPKSFMAVRHSHYARLT